MTFYVAHIHCINPDSLIEEVIRVTDRHSYTYGDLTYSPDLEDLLDFEENLFSRGTISGEVSVSEGTVKVMNIQGRFDQYEFYGFDGQKLELFALESEFDEPGEANLISSVIMVDVDMSWEEWVFSVEGRMEALSIPVQASVFAGDNEGPDGLEGEEDTIKGKTKPMLWGQCLSVPIPMINSSKLIFACNYDKDGARRPIHSVWQVLDKGGILKFNANRTDAAAMQANDPPAGHYDTCLAEGLIRVGTVPVGVVTADVYSVAGESASAPRLVKEILEQVYGLVAGEGYDSESLEALHTLNSASVGYWVTEGEEVTGLELCNALLDSIGGWMAPRMSKYYFGRVDLPSVEGATVRVYDDNFYIKGTLNKIPAGDDSKGIPPRKVEFLHTKVWKMQGESEVLETIPAWLKNFLKEEYRSVVAENPTVTLAHKLAPSLQFYSLMVSPRRLAVPDFLVADIGTIPSNWDYVNMAGLSAVTVNANASGVILSPDGFGGNHAAVGCTVGPGTASAYESLGTSDAVWPSELTLSYEVVAGGDNLVIEVHADGGMLLDLSFPDTGPGRIDFSFTGADSIDVVFRTDDPGGSSPEIKNIRLTHRQYGLTVQEECDRRMELLSARTSRYEFDTLVRHSQVYLGQQILLVSERFSMNEGRPVIVVRRAPDIANDQVTIGVFG